MIKPLGQPVNHRRFERVVMQDRRIDESAELGLAPHGFLGLAPDPCPDRINLIEGQFRLMLCHSCLPEGHVLA